MQVVGRRVMVMLLGWTVSACDGGGGPIPLAELGPRTVQAFCATEVRCGYFPDMASCTGARVASTAQLEADTNAGKVVYDPGAAGVCLDALGAISCSNSGSPPLPQACTDAFKGKIAEGSACTSGSQCASTVCNFTAAACPAGMACCPGTCGPTRVLVAAGGSCAATGTRCADGTFCDLAAATPTCAPRKSSGTSCTGIGECASGLTCLRAMAAATGTCGTYPKDGQDCATSVICDDSHDFCAQATHLCTTRIGVGGDCMAEAQGCVRYANCDLTTHKCVARSAAGGACMAQSDCLGSLDCVGGACALPPPRPVCP